MIVMLTGGHRRTDKPRCYIVRRLEHNQFSNAPSAHRLLAPVSTIDVHGTHLAARKRMQDA